MRGADSFLRATSKEGRRKIEEKEGEKEEDGKEKETAMLRTTQNIPIRPSYRSSSWGRVSPFTRKKGLTQRYESDFRAPEALKRLLHFC